LDVCPVIIGSHTLIGPAVQIYTATHPMNAELRRGREFGRPVTIGSDVWIGGGANVLPGVTIGSRSVIGAGSVVTRDVPAGAFAAGNPCRVIREIAAWRHCGGNGVPSIVSVAGPGQARSAGRAGHAANCERIRARRSVRRPPDVSSHRNPFV